MERWRKRYFPLLAKFVSGTRDHLASEIAELRRECETATADEIVRHHYESLQLLLSNAEYEDRMLLLHRSLLFLSELMVGSPHHRLEVADIVCRSAAQAAAASESALEGAAANRFEAVLQHMDAGIAIFDADGHLRFVNKQMARFLEGPRQAIIGCSMRQLLLHPDLPRHIRKMMVRMIRDMAYNRRNYAEFQKSDGRFLLVSITRIDELDGEHLVSVKDVSDYKRIEQSAFQNDKFAMLGKIAAAIAHEIRNPLTAIRGFIQLLTPYLETVGKQEYTRIILSEIDRANDIIFEFLNASKPSAPMKSTVLVSLLLKETILLSESEAHLRGCELQCELFDPDMAVAIDVKQIKQVLLNIIKNAIDAIAEAGDGRKGRIDVSARRESGFALISIRDNGKGMNQSTLSRLFDPFFSTKESGTGLGLSVSYRIVRNHGGNVNVDSRPGEGTEFMIYLPLTELVHQGEKNAKA